MLTTLGPKGQIVIEKAIRNALGIEPGYVAVQKLAGDHNDDHPRTCISGFQFHRSLPD